MNHRRALLGLAPGNSEDWELLTWSPGNGVPRGGACFQCGDRRTGSSPAGAGCYRQEAGKE
jgi:hypothetical protein